MKTRPRQLWLDCLILAIPFRSHILFKSRALCLSLLSQNRRLSISLLSILQPLLKPALPSYTIFFISLPPPPPPPSLTFYGPPPPSSARFCNTRICLNVFFVVLFLCSLAHRLAVRINLSLYILYTLLLYRSRSTTVRSSTTQRFVSKTLDARNRVLRIETFRFKNDNDYDYEI